MDVVKVCYQPIQKLVSVLKLELMLRLCPYNAAVVLMPTKVRPIIMDYLLKLAALQEALILPV